MKPLFPTKRTSGWQSSFRSPVEASSAHNLLKAEGFASQNPSARSISPNKEEFHHAPVQDYDSCHFPFHICVLSGLEFDAAGQCAP
jgi:hypothetical protein